MAPEKYPSAVNLAKLLWLDQDFVAKIALPGVIGDRYLCVNNPLFERIRSLFLSSGCIYSSEPTRLWRDYGSLSLLMLQEILDSGIVPYKDNFTTLERISSRNPTFEIPMQILLTLLQRNYLLHESAHCVSYRMLSPGTTKGIALASDAGKEQYVRTSILCEAYANTVERLGAALAVSDAHRLFYTLNSFVECREDVSSLLRDSMRIIGLSETFGLSMLVFVYLNLHEDNPDDQIAETFIERISEVRGSSAAERAFLSAVINHGLGLSRRFRTETTPLFFQYLGCDRQFESIRNEPFNAKTISHEGWLEAIATMSSVTCSGLRTGPGASPAALDSEFTTAD